MATWANARGYNIQTSNKRYNRRENISAANFKSYSFQPNSRELKAVELVFEINYEGIVCINRQR